MNGASWYVITGKLNEEQVEQENLNLWIKKQMFVWVNVMSDACISKCLHSISNSSIFEYAWYITLFLFYYCFTYYILFLFSECTID